ncbi:MAG: NAD(P)H-dependent oxidoreductase [Granulosicoccus sp.]
MKYLVVTAHPLDDSLCKHFTRHVVAELERKGHKVTVEDLYDEEFTPTLRAAERSSYYKAPYQSSRFAPQAIRLQEAQGLVLLFPTWWFGFPAILKGWFDCVWGPGIAFDHTENFGPIRPRLNSLEKTLVITTLGSPWWVDRLIMRQPVKRIVKIALLATCAKSSKLQCLSLYRCEQSSAQDIARFQSRINTALQR